MLHRLTAHAQPHLATVQLCAQGACNADELTRARSVLPPGQAHDAQASVYACRGQDCPRKPRRVPQPASVARRCPHQREHDAQGGHPQQQGPRECDERREYAAPLHDPWRVCQGPHNAYVTADSSRSARHDMLTGTSHRVAVVRQARESLAHLLARWCQCVPCTCVLHSVVRHGANTPLPSVSCTAERHAARLTLIVAMLLLLPSAK